MGQVNSKRGQHSFERSEENAEETEGPSEIEGNQKVNKILLFFSF
jgi:hypothetical protein